MEDALALKAEGVDGLLGKHSALSPPPPAPTPNTPHPVGYCFLFACLTLYLFLRATPAPSRQHFPPPDLNASPHSWGVPVPVASAALTQTGGLPLDFRENRIPRSERPAQPLAQPVLSLLTVSSPRRRVPPSLTSDSEGGPLDSTSWNEFVVLSEKKTQNVTMFLLDVTICLKMLFAKFGIYFLFLQKCISEMGLSTEVISKSKH